MPKLFFACRIEDPAARARIAALGELVEAPEADNPDKIRDAAQGAEIVIVPFSARPLLTAGALDALPSLRLVGTTYGGLRQNVDDARALALGLTVIHTGPTRVRPMAEYTLALALAALTRVAGYHHAMCSGEAWPRLKFGRTRILHQRTVGVIGHGLIGRGIAELFRTFTPDVVIHSEHASAESLRTLGFTKAESLLALFRDCEVIILAGGHNPKTHHMIRREHFEAMRDEALFINIARGKMVRQADMIAVAAERPINLALDVFEEEPLEADSPLRTNDRALLAPHRANAPIEFEQRWAYLADELERFTRGERPHTALDPARAAAMSES